MNSKYILPLFTFVVLVQLYVPYKMIIDYEDILESGTYYKFEVAPIDPIDPFRGKFIFLQFKENVIKVENVSDWKIGETAFLELGKDENGYYKPKTIMKSVPEGITTFVKVNVSHPISNENNELAVRFPFERFYIDEFKAPKAEEIYTKSLRDSSHTTYALVAVKNGRGVVKDVRIDDVSIRELIKQ